MAGGADHRPTDSSLAVIEKELAAAKVAFANLIDKDVPAFNRAMTGKGLPALGAPVTP